MKHTVLIHSCFLRVWKWPKFSELLPELLHFFSTFLILNFFFFIFFTTFFYQVCDIGAVSAKIPDGVTQTSPRHHGTGDPVFHETGMPNVRSAFSDLGGYAVLRFVFALAFMSFFPSVVDAGCLSRIRFFLSRIPYLERWIRRSTTLKGGKIWFLSGIRKGPIPDADPQCCFH
jgi:hypothetical protein